MHTHLCQQLGCGTRDGAFSSICLYCYDLHISQTTPQQTVGWKHWQKWALAMHQTGVFTHTLPGCVALGVVGGRKLRAGR